MNENILKKDFQLPKCDKKALGRFVLSFLLPNIVFLCVCFFLSAVRPLISIDYLIPCLLLSFNNRFIRIIGALSYIMVMLIDAYMIIVQFFQFIDIAILRDLIPFMFSGPKIYIFLYVFLFATVIILTTFSWWLNKNQQKIYVIIFSSIVFLIFYIFGFMGDLKYSKKSVPVFSGEYHYIYSQFQYIRELNSIPFGKGMFRGTKLAPYPKERGRAMRNVQQPYNDKILLIIAESLGSLKNEQAQKEIFKQLVNKKEYFDFLVIDEIDTGSVPTLHAELRELCDLSMYFGNDTRKYDESLFVNCLPQILKKQGYHTVAFHGAASHMYHRNTLYPKLGFQKMFFFEQMQDKKICHSFKGTCDSEIFSLIKQEILNHNKIFAYWLTLTSHFPYDERDIFNHRFDCTKFNIPTDNAICRNIKMETQFIDLLAELVEQPEMRGVEVLIVGDHIPPAFEDNIYQTIKLQQSAFAHFKIKE